MAIDRSARGIHWSALDEDISVYNLLAGMPRIYEQHQAQCYRDCRYRVLFLALRGSRRVSQFLDLAAQQQSDPNRTVFYGAYLNDYLQSSDRLFSQLFRTTGSQTVSLLPRKLVPKASAVS